MAGLSRLVLLLGFVSLVNDLASEMIYPLLPSFLTGVGASVAFIGLVEGIAETTASLTKLFSGWLADRLGRKRALTVAGYAFSNIVRPLIGTASAGWHVLVLRFLDRFGKGVRTAPRDAIIADNTSPEIAGRAFGFNRAMDHGGAMLGSGLAFILLTTFDMPLRTIFLLSAVPGLITIAFIAAGAGVARDPVSGPVEAPRLSLAPFGRRFRAFLLIVAIFSLGNSSDAFLLLRANQLGVPVSFLPLIWILFHAVKSLSSMPGGMLSDRLGRTSTIVTGWAIYAAVYLGFSMATAGWHAYILFAAYGLVFGLTEGAERAYVADIVPGALRGTTFGLYHFTIGVVALPASVLCGLLWQNISPQAALGAGATLAGCAGVLFLLLPRLASVR